MPVRGRALLALLLAAALGAGCQPRDGSPGQPRRVEFVTSRTGLQASALVVAPDAGAAAYLTASGDFVMLGPAGQVRFTRRLAGAFAAAIASSGRMSIVGGHTGRRYWMRLIDDRGRIRWRRPISETLLAVAITPDGETAFVSTSGARLYSFRTSRLGWQRIRTDHDISTLAYNETADALMAQTSDPDGYGMVGVDGRTRWWKGRPVGQFTLICGGQGSLLVTTLAGMLPAPSILLRALTPAGRELFAVEIEGYEPRCAVSTDGRLIAMSYRRKLEHDGKSVMERRIELWTRDGASLWREGGLFFKPVLAGMVDEPMGVLIAEDYSLLSALDKSGRLAWRGPALRGDLVRLAHDESWRLGWADFEDGSFELWRMGP